MLCYALSLQTRVQWHTVTHAHVEISHASRSHPNETSYVSHTALLATILSHSADIRCRQPLDDVTANCIMSRCFELTQVSQNEL